MILFLALSALVSTSNAIMVDYTWMESVKKNCRQTITDQPPRGGGSPRMPYYSPNLDDDRAEDLVEDPSKMISNIVEMDKKKMLNKQLSVAPWSDTYWPLYLGAIAQRYNDQNFSAYDWSAAEKYVEKNPAKQLIQNKNFDFLAPSEKYDYVFGINDHNLTQASWKMGEQYYKENGSVETWMGLCHGWSPASFMLPNPKKKVIVKTPAGDIPFYPSDIKALGTLLWANGRYASRFIGGRCNDHDPRTDSMGRPVQPDCLDTNPGTWHKAIVNQIGQFDRALIMDASRDYQVWNQPVFGYQYVYYNPKTGNIAATLNEAMVNKADWLEDPRKSVRADSAKSIVGIKMIVSYVVENSPSAEENQETNFTTAEYDYDLELSAQMDIIGGEWYSDNHPDFLWVPKAGVFPSSVGDSGSATMDLNNISSLSKNNASINATQGLPFGVAVRALFRASAN